MWTSRNRFGIDLNEIWDYNWHHNRYYRRNWSFSGLEFFGYDVKKEICWLWEGPLINSGLTRQSWYVMEIIFWQSSEVAKPCKASWMWSNGIWACWIKNLTLVNPSEWKGDGSSFNVTLTDGLTNLLCIDDNTDISSGPASGTKLSLMGLGGQFDSTDPFDRDQILRYSSDLHLDNCQPKCKQRYD